MTVRELESRLDWPELLEWIGFDRIEPWSSQWLPTGVLSARIHNSAFGVKRAISAAEAIPFLSDSKFGTGEDAEAAEAERNRAILRAMMAGNLDPE
jgi:hypothetical protein